MSIARLTKILEPPTRVEEVSLTAWESVRSSLGQLPSDYREFIDTYGCGVVDDFLSVFGPWPRNEFLSIVVQAHVILDGLAVSAARYPDVFKMPRFPEPGGYLPFAGSDNGDSLFWVTEGDPESWTVAVMGPRSSESFFYDGSMTAFFCDVLERTIRCPMFPSDFPTVDHPSFSARPFE